MAEAPVDPVGPPHGFGPALPPGPARTSTYQDLQAHQDQEH